MKLTYYYRLAYMMTAFGIVMIPQNMQGGEIKGKVFTTPAQGNGDFFPPIVWIEGAKSLSAPLGDIKITHLKGKLDPPVSIGYVGNDFIFRNDDPQFHNTHLYLHLNYQKEASQRPLHYGATLYNIPLPHQGREIRKPIKKYHRYREETGFIEVVCNPHPDEKAYVIIFDHPYCDVAQADGSFSIGQIPVGSYPLMAFHDGTIKRVTDVEIIDDKPTFININMK